jgi:hypothetical protein
MFLYFIYQINFQILNKASPLGLGVQRRTRISMRNAKIRGSIPRVGNFLFAFANLSGPSKSRCGIRGMK